jgi:hypothetical protein
MIAAPTVVHIADDQQTPAHGLRLRNPLWLVVFIGCGWTALGLLFVISLAVGR